jgi:small subunit ribosomal protein S1
MTLNTSTPKESFAELLESSMQGHGSFEGKVVKGRIVAIQKEIAIIDVGLKSEGRVPLKEINARGLGEEVKVGDTIDVFVERIEDRHGDASLSVEKARREAAWMDLEKASEIGTLVNGVIFGKVKGGFAVDLNGAVAFLPGSQVDVRPVRDVGPLMNIVQPFKILKMDKTRSNIVVSRRSVLEETRAEARTELVSQLQENQVVDGIVKNITDYGAFIDLGGVDGLLHVTDISWRRVNHPADVLKLGDTIRVVVIRFNKDTQRISLGMKQLEEDPWKGKEETFTPGTRLKGKITSIADYGAFVELEGNIEGLIYVTEMSWTKKNIHPNKIVTVDQEVDVVVLEVDPAKRRISLGLKQGTENPWKQFVDSHPTGSVLDGVIKNITEFGLFVGVNDSLDGMIHLSDLSWDEPGEEAVKKYTKNSTIQVKVLDVDPEKERISLGVKQLKDSPVEVAKSSFKKGDVVTGSVSKSDDKGIEVEIEGGSIGVIKKTDLSRDRDLQRPDRFAIGEKIDAKVLSVDKSTGRVNMSIKAREMDEEKQVLAEYGSSDSGASLGDILGAAMKKKKDKAE